MSGTNYKTDIFLKKLYYIHTQCAPAKQRKEDEEAEKKMDRFTRSKKKIAAEIRETKRMITERNELGLDEAESAKRSAAIRTKLREIKTDISELEKMQKKRERKVEKKKNPDEEEVQKVENEKEIVSLSWKHIKECERMERYGNDLNKANILFEESDDRSDDEYAYATGIPDIDDPQFEELRQMDQKIDENLDEILKGVAGLKLIAESIATEVEEQGELLDKIEDSANRVQVNLETANTKLKTILKKVRGAREFCCDACCCLLVLGIAACIFYLIS